MARCDDAKFGRYNVQRRQLLIPTENERNLLARLIYETKFHSSGGSFDMLAMWIRRKHRVIGMNQLERPASTISDDYPDLCGIHAELNLYRKQKDLKGGTVYLAGRRSKSGTEMSNTACCVYCSAMLTAAGIRNVIFMLDDKISKIKPIHLT